VSVSLMCMCPKKVPNMRFSVFGAYIVPLFSMSLFNEILWKICSHLAL
jgi:hypothetical protein